jgi:uncharacterized protein (DUF1501 family)
MTSTRREFIQMGLGSSTLLACGATVPAFLARSALAAPAGDRSTGRVLVVLELNGGNDGLNTVVPYGDDAYRKHRPKLQIAAGSLHKVDDHVGLHPALGGLSELLKKRKLAIVQSVGYPNANRSHFESMAIWQTAALQPDDQASGWLNRGVGRRTAATEGDGAAMHIGDTELPRALAGDALDVPSLTRLSSSREARSSPTPAVCVSKRSCEVVVRTRQRTTRILGSLSDSNWSPSSSRQGYRPRFTMFSSTDSTPTRTSSKRIPLF